MFTDDVTGDDYITFDAPRNVGELNYAITQFCVAWVENNGLSYQSINDVLGVLDGVAKEFYLRVAVPYETKKIFENGDVYASLVPPIPETK